MWHGNTLGRLKRVLGAADRDVIVATILASAESSPELLESAYVLLAPLLARHAPPQSIRATTSPLPLLVPPAGKPRDRRSLLQITESFRKSTKESPIAVVEPSVNSVEHILQDPFLSSGLLRFMEERKCEENYNLWHSIEMYQTRHGHLKSPYRLATRIYETFIEPCSPQAVSLLSESRSEVKEALERAKKVPLGQQSEYITIGLFHGIQEEVRDIINTNNVGRYLKDPLYVEALQTQQRFQSVTISRLSKFKDLTSVDLTPGEWSAILAGAERVIHKKGHVISQKGGRQTSLYILDSGTLRCFVVGDHQWIVSDGGTLFGDLTAFRSSQRNILNVTVDSDEAVIYQISMPFLFSYMHVHPAQGVRLFRMICQRISLMLYSFYNSSEDSDFIIAETPAILIEPQHEVSKLRTEEDRSASGCKQDDDKFLELGSTPIITEFEAKLEKGKVRKCELPVKLALTSEELHYSGEGTQGSFAMSDLIYPKTQSPLKPTLVFTTKSKAKKIVLYLDTKEKRDSLVRLFQSLESSSKVLAESGIEKEATNWSPSFNLKDWDTFTSPTAEEECFMFAAKFAQGDLIVRQGVHVHVISTIMHGSCSVFQTNPEFRFLDEMGTNDVGGLAEFFLGGKQSTTIQSSEKDVRILFINTDFIKKRLLAKDPMLCLRLYYQLSRCLADQFARAFEPKTAK